MERDIFPHVGAVPIKELRASELLAAAKLIAARGALDYAHRALQYCGMVFRYAIAHDLAEHNIVADLKGALPTARVKHHATIIDPEKIGPLLRAIDNYDGMFPVKCALQLAPLVFVRPGELRAAAWSEFNFEKAEWRIPAERMKMGEQHIVPLSRQSLATLEELKKIHRPRTPAISKRLVGRTPHERWHCQFRPPSPGLCQGGTHRPRLSFDGLHTAQ